LKHEIFLIMHINKFLCMINDYGHLKDQCDGETSNSYGPITQID
jgi:hypothetical protein